MILFPAVDKDRTISKYDATQSPDAHGTSIAPPVATVAKITRDTIRRYSKIVYL